MVASTNAVLLNDKRCFFILLVTSLVSSLIMLDANVVAVSLPAIGHSLRGTFADLQWVISAYVLTYTALLLASGSFADLCGRKKSMTIGLVVFAVSSAGCGIAPTITILNIARAAQGVGGALLLTASLAILTTTFSGVARMRAFAFWGAALGVALTMGPIVGGIITTYFSWRWIFLINIPISALLVVCAVVIVPESYDRDAKRLDMAGILSFSLALMSLVWALIDGNEAGWGSLTIIERFICAGTLLFAFCFVEARQERPMVDLSLFRSQTFVGSVVAMVGYGAGAQVMIFYLPLFLQNAYGFGPAKAGLCMLPFAVPMILVPRLTKILNKRYSGRAILSVGLLTACTGDVFFCVIARSGLSYLTFVASMLVAGLGAGLLNGETVRVMQGAVPGDRAGMASGLASTSRYLGILVAVAGLGAVLGKVTTNAFLTAATERGISADAASRSAKLVASGDLNGALNLIPQAMRVSMHVLGQRAFADGFAAAGIVAAIVSGVAAVFTFWLVDGQETTSNKST